MAYAAMGVGAAWVMMGALMLWISLFNRRVPFVLELIIEAPLAMFAAAAWLLRFCLRLLFGGRPKRARASR